MDKKGVAFLTTIILLGIVIIVSAALSCMLLRDAFTVKRLKASSQAYYLAEAGIEEAIEYLWRNNFNDAIIAGFSIMRDLGDGDIDVILNTSRWASEKILLIISRGTVANISRTIKTEIKSTEPIYFDYAVLSNGKIFVTGNSNIYCNSAFGIHSNNPTTSVGAFGSGAIDIVGITSDCWVYGNASAVGGIGVRNHGHLTGTKTHQATAVALPSFNAEFFAYYYNLAGSDYIYSGTKTFTTNLAPTTGVIYVNGNVVLEGTITVTGCIVATGDIRVNWATRGTVTQTQVGNLPALMSSGGGIWIGDPANLNGLIYAAGNIITDSQTTASNNIVINGSIISQGSTTISDGTKLDYVKQSPPGLTTTAVGWILNWNE